MNALRTAVDDVRQWWRDLGNPYIGYSAEHARLWDTITPTVRTIGFFRTMYEVDIARYRRRNHALVEGVDYP